MDARSKAWLLLIFIWGEAAHSSVQIEGGNLSLGESGDAAWSPARTVSVAAFEMDSSLVKHGEFINYLNELDAKGKLTYDSGNPIEVKYLEVNHPWSNYVLWVNTEALDFYKSNLNVGSRFLRGNESQKLSPATQVTYFGALMYAESLGRDLPTEAQWMRAAKDGLNITKLEWTKDWQANKSFNELQANTTDPWNNIGTFDSGAVWSVATENADAFFAKKIVKGRIENGMQIEEINLNQFKALNPRTGHAGVGFRTVSKTINPTVFQGDIKMCRNGQFAQYRCDTEEGNTSIQNCWFVCFDCHPYCETCYGGLSTQCKTCHAKAFLYQGSCRCFDDDPHSDTDNKDPLAHLCMDNSVTPCRGGHYWETDRCAPCHPSCKYCDGPNQDDCIASVQNRDGVSEPGCFPLYQHKLTTLFDSDGQLVYHNNCVPQEGFEIENLDESIPKLVPMNKSQVPCFQDMYEAEQGYCKYCNKSCQSCEGPTADDCTAYAAKDRELQIGCPQGSYLHPNGTWIKVKALTQSNVVMGLNVKQDDKYVPWSPERTVTVSGFDIDEDFVSHQDYIKFLNERASAGTISYDETTGKVSVNDQSAGLHGYLLWKNTEGSVFYDENANLGERFLSGNETQKSSPVNYVTYFGALMYAEWLQRDLPTEAQWIRAAEDLQMHKGQWTKDWQANPSFNRIQGGSTDPWNNIGTFSDGSVWSEATKNDASFADHFFFAQKIVKFTNTTADTSKIFQAYDPKGAHQDVYFRTVSRTDQHTVFQGQLKMCTFYQYPQYSCKTAQNNTNNQVWQFVCHSCHPSCETCYGEESTQCMTCYAKAFLHEGRWKWFDDYLKSDNKDPLKGVCMDTSVNPCLGGRYWDQATSDCMDCHALCKYCDGPTSNECINTVTNPIYVLEHGCHRGYKFNISTSGETTGQTTNHRQCVARNGFAIISDTFNYQIIPTNSLYVPCFSDMYVEQTSKTGQWKIGDCKSCHKTCGTCSNPGTADKCLTCSEDREFINNSTEKCVCKTIQETTSEDCVICHTSCASFSCAGKEENECRACKEGLRFVPSSNSQLGYCVCETYEMFNPEAQGTEEDPYCYCAYMPGRCVWEPGYILIAGVCMMPDACPYGEVGVLPGCPQTWIGDDICDVNCYFAECRKNGIGWDGGDCNYPCHATCQTCLDNESTSRYECNSCEEHMSHIYDDDLTCSEATPWEPGECEIPTWGCPNGSESSADQTIWVCTHQQKSIRDGQCQCPTESQEVLDDNNDTVCTCDVDHFVAVAGFCGCPGYYGNDGQQTSNGVLYDGDTCYCEHKFEEYKSEATGTKEDPYCKCQYMAGRCMWKPGYKLIEGECVQPVSCPIEATWGETACPEEWIGDEFCDAKCFFAECKTAAGVGWDGGDCSTPFCHHSCKTCEWITDTECTSCEDYMHLDLPEGSQKGSCVIQQCPDNTQVNETWTKWECANRSMSLTDSICSCPNDTISEDCGSCHASCATCTVAGLCDECLSCPVGSTLDQTASGSGKCKADDGHQWYSLYRQFEQITQDVYYDFVGAQQTCHATCATCDGATAFQCVSCRATHTFVEAAEQDSNKCPNILGSCLCNEGRPEGKICGGCENPCTKCDSDSNCDSTTCVSNAEIVNNTCQCVLNHVEDDTTQPHACKPKQSSPDCEPSQYDQNKGQEPTDCQACDATCQTCNDAGPLECYTCHEGMTFNLLTVATATGSCYCNSGTYWQTESASCKPCITPGCDYCSSDGTNCYRCKVDRIMVFDNVSLSATCTCDQGWSLNTSSNICEFPVNPDIELCEEVVTDGKCDMDACDPLCGTCIANANDENAKTACTSCDDEKLQLKPRAIKSDGIEFGSCASKPGYFLPTGDDATYQKCHPDCKTCTDGGSDGCLSCWDPNMSVEDGTCSCNDGYAYRGPNRACEVLVCEQGKFADSSNVCAICHPTCKTCNGPSRIECLTCPDDYKNLWTTPPYACGCDDGKKVYAGPGTQCEPCDTSCSTCYDTGNTDCITCSPHSARQVAYANINTGSQCICSDGRDRTTEGACPASPLERIAEEDSVEAGCVWENQKLTTPNDTCRQYIYPYCCKAQSECAEIGLEDIQTQCVLVNVVPSSLKINNLNKGFIVAFSEQIQINEDNITSPTGTSTFKATDLFSKVIKGTTEAVEDFTEDMTCSLKVDEISCTWDTVPTLLVPGDKLRVIGQAYTSAAYNTEIAHPSDQDIVIEAPASPTTILVTLKYPNLVTRSAETITLQAIVENHGACNVQFKWKVGESSPIAGYNSKDLTTSDYASMTSLTVELTATPCYGDDITLGATINFTEVYQLAKIVATPKPNPASIQFDQKLEISIEVSQAIVSVENQDWFYSFDLDATNQTQEQIDNSYWSNFLIKKFDSRNKKLSLPANTFPPPTSGEQIYELIIKVSTEFMFKTEFTQIEKIKVTVSSPKLQIQGGDRQVVVSDTVKPELSVVGCDDVEVTWTCELWDSPNPFYSNNIVQETLASLNQDDYNKVGTCSDGLPGFEQQFQYSGDSIEGIAYVMASWGGRSSTWTWLKSATSETASGTVSIQPFKLRSSKTYETIQVKYTTTENENTTPSTISWTVHPEVQNWGPGTVTKVTSGNNEMTATGHVKIAGLTTGTLYQFTVVGSNGGDDFAFASILPAPCCGSIEVTPQGGNISTEWTIKLPGWQNRGLSYQVYGQFAGEERKAYGYSLQNEIKVKFPGHLYEEEFKVEAIVTDENNMKTTTDAIIIQIAIPSEQDIADAKQAEVDALRNMVGGSNAALATGISRLSSINSMSTSSSTSNAQNRRIQTEQSTEEFIQQILAESIDWDTVEYETAEQLVDVIADMPTMDDPTLMRSIIRSFLAAVRREVDQNDKLSSTRLLRKSVLSVGRVLQKGVGRRLQLSYSNSNNQIIDDLVHLIAVDVLPGECTLITTETMNINTWLYLKQDIQTAITTPTSSTDTIEATAFIPGCRIPNSSSSYLLYTYALSIDQQQSGYAEDQEKVGYEIHMSVEDSASGDEVDGTVVEYPCSAEIQFNIPILTGYNEQNTNFVCRFWDESQQQFSKEGINQSKTTYNAETQQVSCFSDHLSTYTVTNETVADDENDGNDTTGSGDGSDGVDGSSSDSDGQHSNVHQQYGQYNYPYGYAFRYPTIDQNRNGVEDGFEVDKNRNGIPDSIENSYLSNYQAPPAYYSQPYGAYARAPAFGQGSPSGSYNFDQNRNGVYDVYEVHQGPYQQQPYFKGNNIQEFHLYPQVYTNHGRNLNSVEINQVWECYPTCADCFGPGINQCLSCNDGFYLGHIKHGYDDRITMLCEPCHYSCETCNIEGNPHMCTLCADGWANDTESSTSNRCFECHQTCQTCTARYGVEDESGTHCISCREDSNLVEASRNDGYGRCVCKNNKVRVEGAGDQCYDLCPTGQEAWLIAGATDVCQTSCPTSTSFSDWYGVPLSADSRRLLLEPRNLDSYSTANPSPYYEIQDIGNMYRTTAGWYFNGESSVKIQDFRLAVSFWVFFQFKSSNFGITLLSGDVKVRGHDQKDSARNKRRSDLDYELDSTIQSMEICINRQGAFVFQIGGGFQSSGIDRIVYAEDTWDQLYCHVQTQDFQTQVECFHINIRGDTEQLFSGTAGGSTLMDYQHLFYDDKHYSDFFVGSYYGVTRHLQGHLKWFWFANGSSGLDDGYGPDIGTCVTCTEFCDISDTCSVDYCTQDQYYNSETTSCTQCDTTCVRGCQDSTACGSFACHRSCDTCGGASASLCYTCHANAYRITKIDGYGYCQCSEGYQGDAWNCKPICHDDNCDHCRGPNIEECDICAAGYTLANTAPSSCIEQAAPTGSVFSFHKQLVTQSDAVSDCLKRGGALASVANSDENHLLFQALGAKTWIALSDAVTEGTYIWADGSNSTYSNWEAGQPDNKGIDEAEEDCVVIWAGLWHDVDCLSQSFYACRYASVEDAATGQDMVQVTFSP